MPRTKDKFEEMRIKSKNNIIQAALKLFSTKGYHATSTSAIAKEAGVAAGLMYNYFSSKEDLLVSIIDQFFEELIISISKKFDGKHELLDARSLIDAIIENLIEKKEYWNLLISITFQPDISQLCINQIEKVFLHQQNIFEKYFEKKGIDKPKENAEILSIILHGALFKFACSGNLHELMLLRKTVIEHILEKGI